MDPPSSGHWGPGRACGCRAPRPGLAADTGDLAGPVAAASLHSWLPHLAVDTGDPPCGTSGSHAFVSWPGSEHWDAGDPGCPSPLGSGSLRLHSWLWPAGAVQHVSLAPHPVAIRSGWAAALGTPLALGPGCLLLPTPQICPQTGQSQPLQPGPELCVCYSTAWGPMSSLGWAHGTGG